MRQTCSETRWMGSHWKRMLSRHIPTQLSWASRCVWTLSSFHCPDSIPLTSALAFLIYSPSSMNDTLRPSESVLRLNHENCFHFLSCPSGDFRGEGTNSTRAMQTEQIPFSKGGLLYPFGICCRAIKFSWCPHLVLGALLIGDGLTQCKSQTVCFPASADSDLPPNKFSPRQWEEGSGIAVFSVGFLLRP